MNIGIVTVWYERGAAYVSRQYRELIKDDFNVFIYARGGEQYAIGDPIWDDRTVTWARKIPLPVPAAIDKDNFLRWIKTNKIETLLFNEQHWWLPVLWCKEIGVTIGAYIDYYTEETIPLFSAYDFLLCNTKRHFETFQWHPGAYYIPWGTDIEIFCPPLVTHDRDGIVTFFHSSGMSPTRKGTDFVIEAFEKIKGQKKLIIHSQVDLLKKLSHMRGVIEKLLQKAELTIIEKTVPAPGCYHLGDVYVYPSRLEGIGLTIAEALASGLPVIVPDNPPMNEFVDETNGRKVAICRLYARSDGYYWPQCDVDICSLSQEMQWYLDRSDQLISFKKQARNYALKYLDWRKNKTKIIELFKNVKTYSNYNKDSIISFETKRAKSNSLLSLYMKWPIVGKIPYSFYKTMKYLFYPPK